MAFTANSTFRFGIMVASLLSVEGALVRAQTLASQTPASQTAPVTQRLDTPSVKKVPSNTPQSPNEVLDIPSAQAPADKSALSSPVTPDKPGATIQIHSELSVKIVDAVNSGTQRNGDKVHGVLASPVRTSNGAMLPSGTSVDATVVSAAKAGTIQSGGVLSLQLTRVGGISVISDVLDFNGHEGHKDVADSAPKMGSEAQIQSGALLLFHVIDNGRATGLQPGVTSTGSIGEGVLSAPVAAGSRSPETRAPAALPDTTPGGNQRVGPPATQGVPPPAN